MTKINELGTFSDKLFIRLMKDGGFFASDVIKRKTSPGKCKSVMKTGAITQTPDVFADIMF